MSLNNGRKVENGSAIPLQLRTKEVASILGVSISKAKEWIKSGDLKSYSIGSMRFVAMEDAVEFVEGYRNKPKQDTQN